MVAYKNLTGARIGRLTVVQNTHQKSKNGSFIWKCLCDCGRQNILTKGNNLISGHTKSCGCMSMSSAERQITQILDNNDIKYIKEYSFSDCRSSITGRLLKFDFAIFSNNQSLLYLLEYDGEQHAYGTKYEKNALKQQIINSRYQQNDKEKDKYCKQNNLKLYRISYKQKDALEDIILKTYEEEKEKCNSSQEKLKKDS